MRPISLTISAFGPFSGTTTLQFDDLKQHSLFLISGPTGAGKTSILDAMVFALFGETSGRLRNGQTMRSDYATDTMATVVTFEFAIGHDKYKIERAPKQTLKKKRGVGTREVDATAILWTWDGEAWQEYSSRRTEVANKIQEILGFRVDQFLQVVLLPQGEFRKLLVAPTSEREALMNSLFKTDIFKRLQDVLKEEYNEVVASAKSVIDEQQYLLNSEQVGTQLELDELVLAKEQAWKSSQSELQVLKGRYDVASTVYELAMTKDKLTESLSLEVAKEQELAAQEEPMKELQQTLGQLKVYETIRVYESQYTNLRHTEESLRQRLVELEQVQEKIEACAVEVKELGTSLEVQKSQFEEYQTFVQQADRIELTRANLLKQQQELATCVSQLQTQADYIEQKNMALKDNETALNELADQVEQLKKQTENERLYIEAQGLCKEGARFWGAWQKTLERLAESLAHCQEAELQLGKSKTKEAESYQAVLLEKEVVAQQQAASMAEHLVVAMPCPVCGSLEHPHKASYPIQFDSTALTRLEEQYRVALSDRSKSEEKLTHAKEQWTARQADCELAKQDVQAWVAHWQQFGDENDIAGKNQIDSADKGDRVDGMVNLTRALVVDSVTDALACVLPMEELAHAVRVYETAMESINKARVESEALATRMEETRALKRTLQESCDTATATYQDLQSRKAGLESAIALLAEDVPKEDWVQWTAQRQRKEAWLEEYKRRLETYDESWKAVDRERTACLTNQVSIREQLTKTIESKMAAQTQYEEAISEAQLSAKRLDELGSLIATQADLERRWEVYKEACVQVDTRLVELRKQLGNITKELEAAQLRWTHVMRSDAADDADAANRISAVNDAEAANRISESNTELVTTDGAPVAGSSVASDVHKDISVDGTLLVDEATIKALGAAYEANLQSVAVNEKEYHRLQKVQSQYSALVANNMDITKRSEFLYNLSDMANGGASGLRGVTFELYVLGTILEEVVTAANLRLRHMSRSRYELQRTPVEGVGRGHRGLDLSVFDNYTGVARPANTLSGGETFLASLALTMGLADVIQAYAGGVHLDTIFIDEGFGTLDPDSLDVAMESLLELQASGRLVGIISHVPELKSRIPAHLEVTPVEQGSVAKFVVP